MSGKGIAIVLFAALAGSAASARGDITVSVGPGGGNAGENVLFNQTGLVTTGASIMGATNQSNAVIDIASSQAGVTLQAVSGMGQATVEAVNGGPFGAFTITPNSLPPAGPGIGLTGISGFQNLSLNIESTVNGWVNIIANAGIAHSLQLDGSGQNFFRIDASGGDVITSLLFQASGDIIHDIKQIRLTGANGSNDVPQLTPPLTPDVPIVPPNAPAPPTVTNPEPAALVVWSVLMLLALAGMCVRTTIGLVGPAALGCRLR
jgi:hypothetical protein